MRTVTAAGSWPGKAQGRVIWLRAAEPLPEAGPVEDRPAEVRRFRHEVNRGLADLEAWSESQPVLEGRLLLQEYRDALQEEAWINRVCTMIDQEGVTAAYAAVAAAEKVSAVMARRELLADRAIHLRHVAQWIAGRLSPRPLPPDAVLAAETLNPLEILDRRHPALIAGPEPPVRGGGPLFWGVPGLGPEWDGKRVAAEGLTITLDESDPRFWRWEGNRLNGHPVCRINGDPEVIRTIRQQGGERAVALVSRLDDLAAVPLFAGETAGVAVELDRVAPGPRQRHPGVRLLLKAALAATAEAGVPLAVGGEAVRRSPAEWLAMGVQGILTDGSAPRRERGKDRGRKPAG